jgi:serine/threonine protein kinase
MFRSEPMFIQSMADVAEKHVTEVKSIFEYEPTGTMYYVMKYYAGETLEDMIKAGQVPSSEPLIIEKIVLPLCKALNAMHSHNILHLDIKPENIVIDENGEAVLIDFGVAHLYDNEGRLVSSRDTHSTSPFSAPENQNGQMRYFEPRSDIFGAAATLFALISNNYIPAPISKPEEKICAEEIMNCSQQMKDAILEGLNIYINDRPRNAKMFLNKFPGCENIKL